MAGLTFADRELLLQTFDKLKADWNGSDLQLLADVCEWARNLTPEFGFEHSLARDVSALSRYLVDYKLEVDIAPIARGALLYVLSDFPHSSSKLAEFGLVDDAFVASYAIHEIRMRLGDTAIYNPPALHKSEQEHAERLFLEFVDQPFLDDNELVSAAQLAGESLAGLAACGLFRRLRNNIAFLITALQDSSRNREHHSYARAALSYIACEQDAIDDRLGIVGYLDDNFIAQMAVEMIEPARAPWLALLDATVAAWPFLNDLSIDDGSGRRSVSEYMIINSALTCPRLRGGEFGSTALILPIAGPVPFFVAFVGTLGLVQESGQRDITEQSFRIGQKVLVDNCAVAEFAGFDDCNGRRMFKLRQYYTERGERLTRDRFWPMSDLRRLVHVDSARIPRGKLVDDLCRSDALLPALEYLFNDSKTVHLAAVKARILVVMPVALAHELGTTMSLHGQRLKDVIPMGHLTDQGVMPWSSRFGEQEPLMIVASDLDAACKFAEEREGQIALVIIDPQGRNANKSASMRRLQQLSISTFVVSSERTAAEMKFDDGKTGIWEWSDDDFDALLWPVALNPSGSGPLLEFDRRLQFQATSETKTTVVQLELASTTFESVKAVRALARERGEEHLVDLDEVVALALGVMSRLLRCAFPITQSTAAFQTIDRDLRQITQICNTNNFLTVNERKAITEAKQLLSELFGTLQVHNPKAQSVRDLLDSWPNLALVCPDLRLILDLERAYGRPVTRMPNCEFKEVGKRSGAIVPGWFGKDRMASLLIPPLTSNTHLVLYEIEEKWYGSFRREKHRARLGRSASVHRHRLFPNVPGWREPDQAKPGPDDSTHDTSLQELESLHECVRNGFRQRVCNSAASDGTEAEVSARLIVFDGGNYSFLTESRGATVVTHLLDNTIFELNGAPEVKRNTVSELKIGDALLFNRGSERDVIRAAADKILEPGVRETSSLWRKALLEYSSNASLTPDQLFSRLREGGCPLQHQTIIYWLDDDQMIAPQAYKRDVAVIASVTGNEELIARIDSVLLAISNVRSAHLRASRHIANQVLARAVNILKAQSERASAIELEENVVVVRIAQIDKVPAMVRASLCNRLHEADAWHE